MIVISQPRYLPAITYVQRLKFADTFVLLDSVQRQARGWENRNQILMAGKPRWLSIPIKSSSREVICKTELSNFDWIDQHKQQIIQSYQYCKYFDIGVVEDYFSIDMGSNCFVDVVEQMLINIGRICEFSPNIKRSSRLLNSNDKFYGPELLLEICKKLDDDVYVSGPNGIDYGVDDSFLGTGIVVKYHQFDIREYQQVNNGVFIPYMAFLDYLFNEGLDNLKQLISNKPVLV